VRVDPSELELSLINLVLNARDAMSNGGVIALTAENITLARGEAKPDPQDKKGPLPVAAVATLEQPLDAAAPTPATPPAEGEAAKKAPKARLVVVGTANLASNQFLSAQGNRDFFMNVVSWLAEDESSISVRARDAKSAPIVLTPPQAEMVLWGPVAVLPGAIILVGILAVVSRRRSR